MLTPKPPNTYREKYARIGLSGSFLNMPPMTFNSRFASWLAWLIAHRPRWALGKSAQYTPSTYESSGHKSSHRGCSASMRCPLSSVLGG